MPGTTRDAVDTVVDTVDGPICFIDTAGMRRRAKTEAGLETYAVLRSLEALDRADLALLVIDATVRATAQDQRLAERIAAAGCPSVVVLNKWDLIATDDRTDVLASIADRLAFLGDAPVLKVAAITGPRRAPRPARPRRPRPRTTTAASRRVRSTARSATSSRTTPRPVRGSATWSRARSTRRRSPCSPRRRLLRSPTFATSSAGCASSSTSAHTPLRLRVRIG